MVCPTSWVDAPISGNGRSDRNPGRRGRIMGKTIYDIGRLTAMSYAERKKAMLLEEPESAERELTRRSRKSMELLLHADFVEFGRTGTRYSRTDVLRKFAC